MVGHIINIFIHSFFSFSLLLILARCMGRKQMAQLTFFDYITGITVGSMAAAFVVEPDVDMFTTFWGLTFWTFFTILLNIIILKSRKARKILDGEPCLVINNGQILEQNMKKIKYSIDDLLEELREKNVFSIEDVQFAVIETDGRLSIQLKPENQPIVKKDVPISIPFQTLPVELVMDGKIIKQNLLQKSLTEDWLMNELLTRNIQSLSDVTYACLGSDQQLYIDVKEDSNTQSFNLSD